MYWYSSYFNFKKHHVAFYEPRRSEEEIFATECNVDDPWYCAKLNKPWETQILYDSSYIERNKVIKLIESRMEVARAWEKVKEKCCLIWWSLSESESQHSQWCRKLCAPWTAWPTMLLRHGIFHLGMGGLITVYHHPISFSNLRDRTGLPPTVLGERTPASEEFQIYRKMKVL